MTGLVTQFSTSSTLSTSLNSAPVLEFRCLYTSDLRRKQKRWQDGLLKYHTFNKRVMVYDERSNYIGDTHWRGEYNFNEGEEVELEPVGILVQVSECIGRIDQDLSELTEKRFKEREQRTATKSFASASSPILEQAVPRTRSNPAGHQRNLISRSAFTQLRPKSLNNILATPLGRRDRAVIFATSPFEVRRIEQLTNEGKLERKPKRPKRELPLTKNGYARNLTGATLILSGGPASTSPQIDTQLAYQSKQQENMETIDLSKFDDIETNASRPETLTASETPVSRANPKDPQQMRRYFSTNLSDPILEWDPNPLRSLALPVATERRVEPTLVAHDESSSLRNLAQGRFIDGNAYDLRNSELSRVCESQRAGTAVSHTELAPKVLKDYQSTSSMNCDSEIISRNANRKEGCQAITPMEQSFGPLRIKSKPKKKMLFMSLAQRDSLHNLSEKNSLRKEAMSIQEQRTEAPQPSVATLRQDASEQLQKHQLSARLHGETLPLLNEAISSSLGDAGIDHRTIDELLFRKKSLQGLKIVRMTPPTESKVLAGVQQNAIEASFVQERTALNNIPWSESITKKDQGITSTQRDIVQAVSPSDGETSRPCVAAASSSLKKTVPSAISGANFIIEARNIAADQIRLERSAAKGESETPVCTNHPDIERRSHLDFKKLGKKDPPRRGKSTGNKHIPQLPSIDLELEDTPDTSRAPQLTMEDWPSDSRHLQTVRLSHQPIRDSGQVYEVDGAGKGFEGLTEAVLTGTLPQVTRLTMMSTTPLSFSADGFSRASETKAVLVAPPKLGGRGAERQKKQSEAFTAGKVAAQDGYGPWSAEAYDLMDWRPQGNTA